MGARFLLSLGLVAALAQGMKDVNTTLLSAWPMVHAHDAATTYLESGVVNDWAKTQQDGGVSSMLDCGARSFDWRPSYDGDTLTMHHGDISIDYAMSDALQEMISWAGARAAVEDIIVLVVSHLDGDGCDAAVRTLLKNVNILYVESCDELATMTVAAAAEAAALPTGGSVLAVSGECVASNWNSSITCSGIRTDDASLNASVASNASVDWWPSQYTCFADSSSKDYPLARFWDYYEAVLDGGPGDFGTLQALWQEDADSVVVSGLHGATLLSEESRSGLNALVAARILETPGAPYGLVEVNNVCDSGPALLAALRSLS